MLYQLSYGGNWSGAEGDRTPDLSVANAALSHLSYGPITLGMSALFIPSSMGATGLASPIPRGDPSDLHQPSGRDRIRTCDLYDVNVAL